MQWTENKIARILQHLSSKMFIENSANFNNKYIDDDDGTWLAILHVHVLYCSQSALHSSQSTPMESQGWVIKSVNVNIIFPLVNTVTNKFFCLNYCSLCLSWRIFSQSHEKMIISFGRWLRDRTECPTLCNLHAPRLKFA